MSRDLQTALREMLRERAGDVDALPERLAQLEPRSESGAVRDGLAVPVELPEPRPARHRRWLLAAAAAAVVLLVAAGLTADQLAGQRHQPAAPNTVTPTSTPTSPSPSTSVGAAPLACRATLPQSWRHAMTTAGSTYGAQSASVVDVAANGDLLVARDYGRGKQRDLALVGHDGTARSVFEVPDPDRLNVRNAYLSGQWLVVSLFADPRPPKHTIPGSSSADLAAVYAVNLATGTKHELASNTPAQRTNGGRTIDDAIELNGVAYWDVRPRYASDTGIIKSYDLRSGASRTVFSGPVGYFVYSAAGVEADGSVIVHAPLPTAVQTALNPHHALDVGTDGTAYAWLVSRDEIAWWTPGLAQPRQLRLPQQLTVPDYPNGFLIVSGQYVVVGDDQLVDMQAGAVAPLTVPGHRSSATLGRPDLLVGSVQVGDGHWDNQGYWVGARVQTYAFDPGDLPGLHC